MEVTNQFQSTLPRRERHPVSAWTFFVFKFQSTLPRRERLLISCKTIKFPKFQSTLPRRERRLMHLLLFYVFYFNPHSHEGSDIIKKFQLLLLLIFQSTLPRRERPDNQSVFIKGDIISIHTPTKGATFPLLIFKPQFSDFNPHSHEGSDYMQQ